MDAMVEDGGGGFERVCFAVSLKPDSSSGSGGGVWW